MSLRLRLKLLVLLFLGAILCSFGIAGYLLLESTEQPAVPAASPRGSDRELLARAEQLLHTHQTEQALVLYRRILASNPTALDAQLGLARGELLAGREDLAAQEFERALRLSPQNAPALRQLARIYSHQPKTWGLAEKRLREYVAIAPDDGGARVELARLLFWQGKWKQAAEAYSSPRLAGLLDVQDQRGYVVALVKSGQTRQAEVVSRRFLADGSQDFELRLQLATLYAARQDWESALPLYRALLQERPEASGLNLTYGVGLLSVGDYRAALGPLAKACAGMPASAEAGLAYARALRGVKDLESAVREFERVLPSYRADMGVVREYADLLLERRDYRKAETYYRQAYEMGLRDVRLLVSLSGALRGNRKPRAALPYLEEAYRLEPTDRLGFELAKLMHEIGRTAEASRILDQIEPTSTRRTQ